MEKLRININGKEILGLQGQTILEAARENDIYIPTLCFSEQFEPYASCGICLVEVEGSIRPLRACATNISNGMIVRTESAKIKKARKTALELLLSDHRGDCRGPCVMACPANCDAQGYVALAANGMFREALALVKEFMPFPGSVGRVCPAPCEKDCRRSLLEGAVSIRYIKRLLADLDMQSGDPYVPPVAPDTNKKIAIVGAGPAGLTAAYFLRRMGHSVTVFEALPKSGGMFRYGIPEYRLPKNVLDWEISQIERLGVEIKNNMLLGKDFTVDFLLKSGYHSVYIAIGAQVSKKMGVPGEELLGVIGGADFLRSMFVNGDVSIGRKVAVIGGGNVAMDAVRTSRRLGAEQALIIYRRGWDEMPAQAIEVHEAKEEGVEFHLLTAPVRIEGNGKVEKIVCQKMELGQPDSSGRRRPQPIADAFIEFEVDTVIAAIGQDVMLEKLKNEIEINKYNTISVDQKTFSTNIPGVFAGGDAVTGPDDAILAISSGKKAALLIDKYLSGHQLELPPYFNSKISGITEENLKLIPSLPKANMPLLPADIRVNNFMEVEQGITPEEAIKDGMRCLECGCLDAFECKLRKFSEDYPVEYGRIKGEMHEYEKSTHPFIIREQDKCILCGLCVQTCSKVVGAEALGLVNRGFETYIAPTLDMKLEQTNCISCGQCVSICPTGALCENIPVDKKAAWELNSTDSVCGFCGVGCQVKLETSGENVLRVLPSSAETEGLLCHRGRFGFGHINNPFRITSPSILSEGTIKSASIADALEYTVNKVKALRARYGNDSIAVLAGPRYSNEDLYLIQKMTRAALGTNNIGSIADQDSPVGDIFGWDVSTNSYDEINAADMIIAAGVDIKDYPVMAMKMRKAALNGAKLWTLDNKDTDVKSGAHKFINLGEQAQSGVFAAILVCLIKSGKVNLGYIANFTDNFPALSSWAEKQNITELLAHSSVTEKEIAELAENYANSKTPIIAIGRKRLDSESIRILAMMAAITGKAGLPRRGIIYMKERCNSQGLTDMGISPVNLPGYQKIQDTASLSRFARKWKANLSAIPGKDIADILEGIENETIKGVFIFGENPAPETISALRKAELLVVHEQLPTFLTMVADVVLPAASFAETEGSYTNSGRLIQMLNPAFSPISIINNRDLLFALMEKLGYQHGLTSIEDIRREIASLVPMYSHVNRLETKKPLFWDDSSYSDIERIVQVNGKIKLQIPDVTRPAMRHRSYVDSMLLHYYEELADKNLEHII